MPASERRAAHLATEPSGGSSAAPEDGTVERWAFDYVTTESLAHKLAPPAPPATWEAEPSARRLMAPGRPPELRVVERSPKTPRPGALARPAARAALLATFLHHELQAAELMAWALLAFPDTPREFRAGLVRIAQDEVRHMQLYRAHVERLGHAVGEFPVRDWFWERVPRCATPTQFVAVLGLGFEGANLDHSALFARRFREAGDEPGARLQERVGQEEVAHVRFAARWFRAWTGGLEFEVWRAHLPAPLGPILMRGPELEHDARRSAGLDDAFVSALEAWSSAPSGS